MFNWFGKKQQEVAPPAQSVVPEVSPSESLRARIKDAQKELQKIDEISRSEKKELAKLQEELTALELRAAGLTEAIEVGGVAVASDSAQAEKFKVYIKLAKDELSENQSKQIALGSKIDNLQSFLQAVEEQKSQLEEIVRNRDQRLTALEVREVNVKINQSISAVDNNIDDYRRHVYTSEAQHELSTGMI